MGARPAAIEWLSASCALNPPYVNLPEFGDFATLKNELPPKPTGSVQVAGIVFRQLGTYRHVVVPVIAVRQGLRRRALEVDNSSMRIRARLAAAACMSQHRSHEQYIAGTATNRARHALFVFRFAVAWPFSGSASILCLLAANQFQNSCSGGSLGPNSPTP